MSFIDQVVKNFDLYRESPAFVIKDQSFSYGKLEHAVRSVYNQLDSLSIPGKRVGLFCYDSLDTYATIVALWCKGYAFVPLGFDNPEERNNQIIESAGIEHVFTASDDCQVDRNKTKCIRIDTMREVATSEIKVQPGSDDVAYILFTSGSTGLPKGVPISYKNLQAFVDGFLFVEAIAINPNDRCLQMFELTFDVSIASFLMPLLNGASVYTLPNGSVKYVEVLKVLTRYNLTYLQIVPSIIKLAKKLLSRVVFAEVRVCILTGEATNVDLLEPISLSMPSAHLCNLYGPTEATIYCSYYQWNDHAVKNYNGMLAIGKPLHGIEFMIVDEALAVVNEVAVKGELCIGGEQLTMGYLNDISKNQQAFISLEVNGKSKVFYKSGDMCFFDNDLDFFYCGRFDNQVKINGFRVELSEIEFAVKTNFGTNNIAFLEVDRNSNSSLCLVLESDNGFDEDLVLGSLREKLPHYMVPKRVVALNEFPLNSSGKTDRKKIVSLICGAND